MKRLYTVILFVFALLLAFSPYSETTAQSASRPFIHPAAGSPGLNTWLLGQAYGNTTGAYNFGDAWYRAGQGLHFGLDYPMPCGTELVAVADGVVTGVDNLGFGSGPHNLILRHPDSSLTTLYGHLLETPRLVVGQEVRQGDFVGYSGDPDSTCDSRPHLHFEVRSLDYFTAYNPVDYINANWHILAAIGGYGYPLFQADLENARRWLSLENQPSVRFGGPRLNAYSLAWPLPSAVRPPANPPLLTEVLPLPEQPEWTLRQIGVDQCCWLNWWDTLNPDRIYIVDGAANQRASVQAWSAESGTLLEVIDAAPPAVTSPMGDVAIYNNGSEVLLRRRASGEELRVQTGGETPSLNPSATHMTWTQSSFRVPGQSQPPSNVWLSSIDGSDARVIFTADGASGTWLDDGRLLISTPGDGRLTTLSVYDRTTEQISELGTWYNMRGLSIAPGGGRVMFYISWQENPADNGIYVINTEAGATAQKIDWFGAWRWRDANSVYYLPYQPDVATHSLRFYDLNTGEDRLMASAETGAVFTIMNGDWDVSADGRRILFQNALDSNLWLLELNVE